MSHHNNNNKATTVSIQTKLNGIHTKAVWGARSLGPLSNNLVNIGENEFVVPVGCTFLYLDSSSSHSRKAYLAETHHPEALYVTRFAMSKDSRYFAASVKTKFGGKYDINIHIHHLEYRFHESFRPRQLQYTVPSTTEDSNDNSIEVTSLCFSNDSQFLAVATDRAYVGILIFDQIKGSLFQTLAVDGIPLSVSFHPNDSSKICVTGDNNMVRFWRFSNKNAHLAPVVGLRKGNFSYCCHCWIAPFSETSIVIGSTSGFIVPIQNCEQRTPIQQSFGNSDLSAYHRPEEHAITQMLIKGDHIIVASPKNQIVLYEVRRSAISKGSGLTASLAPLACYSLPQIDRIYGLAFANRDSITSYGLVACCSTALVHLDIISDFDLSGGNSNLAIGNSVSPNQSPTGNNENSSEKWIAKHYSKEIYKFHAAPVQCLSFSSRSNSFLSSSFNDRTVRVWDYDKPSTYEPCWLVESFADRPLENPLFIDFHPSGLQVAVASEIEIKEYAISDGQFDLMRKFNVRTPFQGSNGVPIVVSQPVTMVKYSNGGQMIAVVAGKYVQIFHSYSPDFDMIHPGDCPMRVVSLCDHISPITDLVFLRGDLKIVTTSLDGSVYSWLLNGKQRDKEFVQKGIAATHVVATKHHSNSCTIIATFEPDVYELNHPSVMNHHSDHRRKLSNIIVGGGRRGSGAFDINSRDNNNINLDEELQKSIGAFSDAKSVTSNTSSTTNNNSNGLSIASKPQHYPFLAVWADDISNAPTIVQLEMPARSIALGRSGGNDRFDLCVVGFDDGRILISALPLPLILVRSAMTALTAPVAAAANMLSIKRRKNSHLFTTPSNNKDNDSLNHKGQPKVGFGSHFLGKEKDDLQSLTSGNSHTHKSNSTSIHHNKSGHISNYTNDQVQEEELMLGDGGDDSSSHPSTNQNNAHANTTVISKRFKLEESKCRWLRLLASGVQNLCFSIEGNWLVVGGDQGTLMMLATHRSLAEMDLAQRSLFSQSIANNSVTQNNSSNSTMDNANDNAVMNSSSDNDHSGPLFFLMERSKVNALKARLQDLEAALELSKKENELHVAKMLEAKEKAFIDMESRLKREIQKRDEAILTSRKEYLAMKKRTTEEVELLKKTAADNLSAMETSYEKKIAQDALYMDRLKQAYDEYVLHMKMDMSDLNAQTASRVKLIEQERQDALKEAEKQKRAVLAYYEYLQQRNDEVLDSLEETQAEEQLKMRKQLDDTNDRLQTMQNTAMSNDVHHTRVVAKFEADKKHLEIEVLRVNNDIDWANDRIAKLEDALSTATNELKVRSEMVERAEMKASEATKKAEDMEKIRKTLMVQLEALQRDIAPKDRELSKTTDKMQELVREYEVALAAIAEKEKTLEHKTQNLLLLQKQVRELRSSNAQKDSALSRAATLLSEFLFAMQEARFQPRKSAAIQQKEIFLEQRAQAIAAAHNSIINSNSNNKNNKTKRLDDNDHNEIGVVNNNNVANSNNNNNSNTSNKSESKKKNTVSASDPHYVVSSLHLDTSADLKLRSLHDVLKNFMSDTTKDAEIVDEIEAVRREQERHVVLLHRNIQSLKNSLDSSQQLAQTKLQNHLQDNEVLLKEVNALRCEVKALSLENHRLQATLDFRQTNNVVNSNKGFQMISGDLDSSNNNSNLSTSRDIDRDNRERDGRRIHSRNHSRAGSKHGTQLIGVALQDSLAQQLLQSNDSLPRASISAGDVAKQALPPLQALPHLYSAVNGEPNGWEESQTLSLPRLSAPSAGLQFPPPQLHNSHNSIPLQSSSANLHMGITQNPHMSHLSHSQSHSRGPSVLEVEVPTSLNSHHNHMKGLSYSKSQQSVSQSQSFVLQQQSRSIASLDSHEPSSFAMDVTGASLLHKQGGVSSAEDKINAIMQMNLAEIRSNPTTQQASQPQTQQKQAAQNRPKANIKSSSAKQVATNKAATSHM